jgi:hypothetical protein
LQQLIPLLLRVLRRLLRDFRHLRLKEHQRGNGYAARHRYALKTACYLTRFGNLVLELWYRDRFGSVVVVAEILVSQFLEGLQRGLGLSPAGSDDDLIAAANSQRGDGIDTLGIHGAAAGRLVLYLQSGVSKTPGRLYKTRRWPGM